MSGAIIGAPFEGTWDAAAGAAIYPAAGSGELIWTIIAAAICVLAIIIGGIQEGGSYRRLE